MHTWKEQAGSFLASTELNLEIISDSILSNSVRSLEDVTIRTIVDIENRPATDLE